MNIDLRSWLAGGAEAAERQRRSLCGRTTQRMRLLWDSLSYAWQDRVIDYNQETQRGLLERMGLVQSRLSLIVASIAAVSLVAALVTQCLMYERMTGDTRYRDFATLQRDWLLGRNPWGTTMFTEIGSSYPTDVHLMTTKITGRKVRGALVDGPVYERIFKSLKGVEITQPDPLAAFQGLAVYHNSLHDYSSNEPTMDGTASAILMFALCTMAK